MPGEGHCACRFEKQSGASHRTTHQIASGAGLTIQAGASVAPSGHLARTNDLVRAPTICSILVAASLALGGPSAGGQAPPAPAAIAKARADSARLPYTTADVQFMQGMIHHHAQAIVMARWAPSHGASPAVRTLAARIINSQQDEIATMGQWLRNRQQPVPDTSSGGMMPGRTMPGGTMSGMPMDGHPMLMPGMLTDDQLRELDSARGPDFDRLFLTFMIQHHTGAIAMVHALFETPGAGQDEKVFKFASDANVDQTTEIARMKQMLAVLTFQGPPK